MEENFKKIVELIKETTLDPEETKKYILVIKRVFRKAFENCKEEISEEQILKECLQAYEEDLQWRGNAEVIYNNLLIYDACKRILEIYRGNKAKYDQVIKEAKKRELKDKEETLTAETNPNESMVAIIRSIIRSNPSINEKRTIEVLQREKARVQKELKDRMIPIIQSSVSFLDEYGIMDEYIEVSNSELEKLGLPELKYLKRNPIPDEQHNENGDVVENVEDIGVMDTFSRENLESLSVHDLEILTAFWESKYFQERICMSKAMSTIRTLDLWDTIFHGEDQEILNLDNSEIKNALKKDLALTYLCKNGVEITPKINKHYKKFLKQNDMESSMGLEEELSDTKIEMYNLSSTAKDIGVLECLIVNQLMQKDIKTKKWGIVKVEQVDFSQEEEIGTTIAIEVPNFRGTLIMGVPDRLLSEYLKTDNIEFPEYKKQLDENYSNVMAKIYLPSNKFYIETIKQLYKQNPTSELLADLAGKKVKGQER